MLVLQLYVGHSGDPSQPLLLRSHPRSNQSRASGVTYSAKSAPSFGESFGLGTGLVPPFRSGPQCLNKFSGTSYRLICLPECSAGRNPVAPFTSLPTCFGLSLCSGGGASASGAGCPRVAVAVGEHHHRGGGAHLPVGVPGRAGRLRPFSGSGRLHASHSDSL
jgi:hypothetical protein